MKKLVLFIAAIALIAGCTKKEVNNDEPIDKWNGYGHLKTITEWKYTLWAGKHDSAGYVTYYFDDDNGGENPTFYATYTTVDGWEMTETHFFADD